MRLVILGAAALMLSACGGGGGADVANQQAAGAAMGSQSAGCARFFVNGKMPVIADEKMKAKTRVLCFRSFAVTHSGVVRQPLWSAEMLTQAGVDLGRQVSRQDNFHPEAKIPAAERAEIRDYTRSGYDRGHMAPDADMPSRDAANEAFSLANMVPQAAKLNRGSWADLEKSVRRQTRGGTVYVVSGPLFIGPLRATHPDGRVKVPSHTWKAMYAVGRGATTFTAVNSAIPRWTTMTVDQFSKVYGIDPFPGLDPKFRTVNGALNGSLGNPNGAVSGKAAGAGANGAGAPKKDNRLIKDPVTHQYMSADMFRASYKREPREEEYEK